MTIISIPPKRKVYKCHSSKDREWREITASCPQEAAQKYAWNLDLSTKDIVSVWGVGKFSLSIEKIYKATII